MRRINTNNKALTVLDIFSGIGGFSLGLEKAGMKTIAFCENNIFCQEVLKTHWQDIPVFSDVRDLSEKDLSHLPKIDVIAGGFPCQDISVAGKQAGINGERSGLWKEFKRLINEVKPKYAIIENVANLRSCGLSRVLKDLWEIGYNAEWHLLPASAFGALHRRDRIWIIAYPACFSKSRLSITKEKKESKLRVNGQDAANTDGKRCNCGQCNRQERHVQNNKEGEHPKVQSKRNKRKSGACKICKVFPDTNGKKSQGHGEHREVSTICTQKAFNASASQSRASNWREEPVARLASTKNNKVRLNPDWVEWLMGYPLGWTKQGSLKERLQSLGNSVVPIIPEYLGGEIKVKSEINVGSTFTFTFKK